MKSIVLALALTLSTSAFARQYFQCTVVGDSTDVAVVNLQTINNGTLFLSTGMQDPYDDRILLNFQLAQVSASHHIYQVIHEASEGFLWIPSNAIGRSSDRMTIDLKFAGHNSSYICFSRIYND